MLNKKILSLACIYIFSTPFSYSADAAKPAQNLEEEPNPIGHLLDITPVSNSNINIGKLHYLIKTLHKVNPNFINAQRLKHRGHTPLHVAVYKEHKPETIQLLLEFGADTTKTNNDKVTPLEFACVRPATPTVIDIIKCLAEHEKHDQTIIEKNKQKQNSSPLHYIMKNTSLHDIDISFNGIIPLFLECGYDLNAKDEAGNTPLHYAHGLKRDISSKTLLEHGACNLLRNLNGHTPVELRYPITITTDTVSDLLS